MNDPVELVLSKLTDAKRTRDGWSARCPAHEDRTASLSVGVGDHGKVLLRCHAGCAVEAICGALGLRLRDLMPATNGRAKQADTSRSQKQKQNKPRAYPTLQDAAAALVHAMRRPPDAGWFYHTATGERAGIVYRWNTPEGKEIRPVSLHPDGWSITGMPTPRPLYRLPDLAGAKRVYLCEGEKAVEAARSLGFIATTSPHGAKSYALADWTPLAGCEVIALPDNDGAGEQYVAGVAGIVTQLSPPATARILRLPDLPDGGDVYDFVEMRQAEGASLDDIRSEIDMLSLDAPVWRPDSNPGNPSMATTGEWADIDRFEAADLPAFPVAALPDVLRAWVAAESHATQTPPDLAGLLALAVCSAGIARRVVVEARDGFIEPTNLYAAILLDPANRKSCVFRDATEPLKALEAELIEQARPDVARRQSERRQAEAKLKRLEKQAADTGDAAVSHEACELAAELAATPEPALPRLIVDDVTTQKLGVILEEQGGRVASMSAEASVFDIMAGLYSKNGIPDFSVYLMGHAGDDIITDRIGRKSLRVERPALTCAYAIQPAVIAGLGDHAAFRGRGLLGRFVYAAPRSWIGSRQIATPPVPTPIREAYWYAVRTLAADNAEHVLRVDHGADERFRAWEAEIEGMLADGSDLETVRDWGGKLAGVTLRLAAVLHSVEHGPVGWIGQPTVEAAITIARYLIPHAERVLTMMAAGARDDSDAQYLLRWILRHGKATFSRREAQQHGKRRFKVAEDIDPALAELQRRHYIRPRQVEPCGPGRPASPTFDVHPAVFEFSGERSQYSQNSTPDHDLANIENTENAGEECEWTG